MGLDPRIAHIPGYMTTSELEWIFRTSESLLSESVIVEIGSYYGKSTAAWCSGAGADKTVICVDTWEGTPDTVFPGGPLEPYMRENVFEHFQHNMRSLGFYPCALRMDSVKAARLFAPCSLDLVFIDGDHFKIDQDLDAWVPRVKIGGLVCGHDWAASPWHVGNKVLCKFPQVSLLLESIWGFVVKEQEVAVSVERTL